jgi:tetratricopeptide (TPR) repeat protein
MSTIRTQGIILIVLLALLANWSAFAEQDTSSKLAEEIKAARSLLQNNELAKLKPIVETLKKEYPADHAVLILSGDVYLQQHQYQQALEDYSEVIKTNKNSVEANIGRAESLIGLGDARAALPWAKMAASIDGDNPRAWHILGEVYLNEANQDYPRAEEAFRKELELEPTSREGRLKLVYALNYQKKVYQSIDELKAALSQKPRDVPIMLKLAEIYYVNRELDKAEGLVHEVMQIDPNNAEALKIMGQIRSGRSYYYWVIGVSAVVIPLVFFGMRWLKKGRTIKE